MKLAPKTHIIVEVAKALGGSFKLVTPAPKPVGEMTQLPREHERMGEIAQAPYRQGNLLSI